MALSKSQAEVRPLLPSWGPDNPPKLSTSGLVLVVGAASVLVLQVSRVV